MIDKVKVFYAHDCKCELLAIPSFFYTDKETLNRVCNGCGTRGIGGWLVPDKMWGLKVTTACNIHDWMYSKCETPEDEDYSDFIFRENLRRVIKARTKNPILRWLRLRRADLYFICVALTYCANIKKEL